MNIIPSRHHLSPSAPLTVRLRGQRGTGPNAAPPDGAADGQAQVRARYPAAKRLFGRDRCAAPPAKVADAQHHVLRRLHVQRRDAAPTGRRGLVPSASPPAEAADASTPVRAAVGTRESAAYARPFLRARDGAAGIRRMAWYTARTDFLCVCTQCVCARAWPSQQQQPGRQGRNDVGPSAAPPAAAAGLFSRACLRRRHVWHALVFVSCGMISNASSKAVQCSLMPNGRVSTPGVIVAHFVLMLVACACLSLGVALAANGRVVRTAADGAWLVAHRRLQLTGLLAMLGGFACALAFAASRGGGHFKSSHTLVGITVIALAVFQPAMAAFRPKAAQHGKKSTERAIWEAAHRSSATSRSSARSSRSRRVSARSPRSDSAARRGARLLGSCSPGSSPWAPTLAWPRWVARAR